jgi:hypothetical protein
LFQTFVDGRIEQAESGGIGPAAGGAAVGGGVGGGAAVADGAAGGAVGAGFGAGVGPGVGFGAGVGPGVGVAPGPTVGESIALVDGVKLAPAVAPAPGDGRRPTAATWLDAPAPRSPSVPASPPGATGRGPAIANPARASAMIATGDPSHSSFLRPMPPD